MPELPDELEDLLAAGVSEGGLRSAAELPAPASEESPTIVDQIQRAEAALQQRDSER